MASLPRVTIVTPSLNQFEFLEKTLRSVLDQEYPNLEYLVVDGGSTDGSVDVIRRYADQLSWWVSEPDSGQAAAINKGFARATGKFIAWLNSDDLYLPGAIASAVRAFADNPTAGLVFSDVVSIDGAGEPINVMKFASWGLDELLQFNIISQPGVFLRREVLEKAGYLEPDYHFMLDLHLWLRCAQVAPIQYIPQRWAAARFHENAKNVAQAPGFGRESYRLVDWMQTQPGLARPYARLKRRIWAGAYRMNGRYLLDANQPKAALSAYWRGLLSFAPIVLPETRRMLYAAASLVLNVESLKKRYLQSRKKKLTP